MKFNLKEIAEGWRNHLLPPEELKDKIKQTSDARLEVCRGCEHNSDVKRAAGIEFRSAWRVDEHCTVCNCPLLQKTKALHSSCPLDPPKWGPVVTNSEAITINDLLTNAEKRTSQ